MEKFNKEIVMHLGNLSAMNISDEECNELLTDLNNIEEMISEIQKDDSKTFEYNNIHSLEDLREDEAKESLPNEKILMNAPNQTKGMFKVPAMME